MRSPNLAERADATLGDQLRSIFVLHVVPSLGRGGAEAELVGMIRTLPDEFQHLVCYLRPPDFLAGDIRAAGHRVLFLGATRRRPWLAAAIKLAPLLRRLKPDVVHTWLYDAHISARLAAATVRSTPQVCSLQAPPFHPQALAAYDSSPLRLAALKRLDQATAAWVKPTFVACSSFVADSASAHLGLPRARIRVIYNATDAEARRRRSEDAARLRRDHDIPAEAFVFLNVGRLSPQKGQAILLRAFAATARRDSHLVLAGDGPLRAELVQLANDLGIAGQTRFLGIQQDIEPCLEMADVFVFPSLWEGLPVALIEAMAKALPVIASSAGPMAEVVDDGYSGVLVPPADPDRLADAMTALRADSERRAALGQRAQETVRRRFSMEVVAPQWEALYRGRAGPADARG
jgi:glycosyltransferase involved in cell wall biosynthesis